MGKRFLSREDVAQRLGVMPIHIDILVGEEQIAINGKGEIEENSLREYLRRMIPEKDVIKVLA
jgi:hypothetical protein